MNTIINNKPHLSHTHAILMSVRNNLKIIKAAKHAFRGTKLTWEIPVRSRATWQHRLKRPHEESPISVGTKHWEEFQGQRYRDERVPDTEKCRNKARLGNGQGLRGAKV